MTARVHRMPFGAAPHSDGTLFRLFAPQAHSVGLRITGGTDDQAMQRTTDGWFELRTPAPPGTRYHFVIDGKQAVPDPASRFQPEDVNGPSEVIASDSYDWSDGAWRGRPWRDAVIYELHLGTFTQAGTYRSAIRELQRLRDLGITAIELMPLADFAGRHNWGYDGALPFAPDHRYGRPEDLKALIDEAHRLGLMVFIDVVYNHFGPEGNYLPLYDASFFGKSETGWGQAIDFGGIARRFFIENALYWLTEYHVDGLRFDAVHAIEDDSEPHILEELAQTARTTCSDRPIHLVLENDRNEARYLERDAKGVPVFYDAQWNDDFHHVMHVVTTGETDGYYSDYADAPVARLGRCLAEGFAYQGEQSPFREAPRGEPSAHLSSLAFVNFLQNHDQIGNRALGERLISLAPRDAVKAAIAIQLLAPSPPLLFMGEEVGATGPFLFFCDFAGELGDAVREGRRREFARFAAFASPDARAKIPDPLAEETFRQSNIADAVAKPDAEIASLYRDLLAVRHREIVPRLTGPYTGTAHAATRGRVLSVTWTVASGDRLILLANLSDDPNALMEQPCGRILWQSASGPWSVTWSIEAS